MQIIIGGFLAYAGIRRSLISRYRRFEHCAAVLPAPSCGAAACPSRRIKDYRLRWRERPFRSRRRSAALYGSGSPTASGSHNLTCVGQ
jgi:hypothetical protein